MKKFSIDNFITPTRNICGLEPGMPGKITRMNTWEGGVTTVVSLTVEFANGVAHCLIYDDSKDDFADYKK